MSKKHLIVVGHPDTDSFCYNGIYKTIKEKLESNGDPNKSIIIFISWHSVVNMPPPKLL